MFTYLNKQGEKQQRIYRPKEADLPQNIRKAKKPQ
jgi:hypothetical protein